MTQTPTIEQFLAMRDGEEQETPEDLPADPLVSIADSLRQIAAAAQAPQLAIERDERTADALHTLEVELADLECKHQALTELLAEVEKILKPSTSKLANSVRDEIERWKAPEVIPAGGSVPAHDADVEEWRQFARNSGYAGPDVDQANRSQIRTMLGIEHGVNE